MQKVFYANGPADQYDLPLIQYTSINYQKANTTTAGNYSSLNSWVDTFTFTLIVVIKPDILIGCNMVLYS